MTHVRKIKAGGVNTTWQNFVGEAGTLFYDHTLGNLRLSDGHTPGGVAPTIYATTATFAQSFNTATLVAIAVTSTFAQSFNTSTLVNSAVYANTASGNFTVPGNLYVGGIVTATTFVGSANPGTTSTTASALGYLGMPQLSTATSYTLVASDQGKHIYITATAQTITIPANSSVAYPIGTTIAFIGGPSATTTTIAITTDTMYLGGTGTTGNRTLAAYGMATLVKVGTTTWFINGPGLT